jgi:hypothetical protein
VDFLAGIVLRSFASLRMTSSFDEFLSFDFSHIQTGMSSLQGLKPLLLADFHVTAEAVTT